MRSLLLALVLGGVTLAAQQPAQAPALDALDRQALALEGDAEALWREVATKLPEYQLWMKTRAYVDAQVKAKYPGYRVNWATKQLEAVK